MAVRFIVGRAGSGKTYHCLEAVRSQLRLDPIDGPRLILLVPEQAGLQMERAILQPEDIAAAHRVDVLSFQRLAFKVLESTGGASLRAISESARTMVLRHLVGSLSDQLRYYRRVDRIGGFIDRLGATIAELIQEAVEPEALAEVSGRQDSPDPAGPAKLHDLHLIYSAYLDYLGTERLDPSQFLQVARERFCGCSWLSGAELWVDGFASLSGQETLALIALVRQCRRVDITALMDPTLVAAVESTPGDRASELFRRTHRTYRDLDRAFRDAGLELEEPLLLRRDLPPRFERSRSLAQLERSLFSTDDVGEDEATPPRDVQVVALSSRRREVDFAVARVQRWVQEAGGRTRYRDVAIIARDLEPYHDLLSETLTARGIPFFIDRRRPTAHHPVVELLRGGVGMAAEPFSLESVRLTLKTGLLPIGIDDADELENFLLARGLAGEKVWRGEDWQATSRNELIRSDRREPAWQAEALKRINATRRKMLTLFEPLMSLTPLLEGHLGGVWADATRSWLDRLGVEAAVDRWSVAAEADGDVDQAAEHQQVWRDAQALLDDVSFAFSGVKLSAAEFGEVFEQGLASLSLGLAPPMIDQVLVGSIERSRHPELKAAIILGFNDGVFPGRPQEDSILNDDDRDWMRDGGVAMGPSSRERVLDEALLVYIALTRASGALVVSYSAADDEGRSLRPSPYVEALLRACPGLAVTRIDDPLRTRDLWDILTERDLATRLVMEFRTRQPLDDDDPQRRGRWNELYDLARSAMGASSHARGVLAALVPRPQAALSPESVARLIPSTLRASVSQLETYAACPFQHFARYGLKLRERAEASLAPVDVGQVHHAILEDVAGALAARRASFHEVSEEELLESVTKSWRSMMTRVGESGPLSGARDAYILRRSASHLARVVRAQRRVSELGRARPRAAELPFGFDKPGGMPALEVSTPAGRRVLLRGYIDRVDLAEVSDELLGVVIDYKTTRDKQLDLSRVYHGLSLQLPGYLLALGQHGRTLAGRPIRPIAGLYVSLAPRYLLVDHPDLVSERDASLGGTFRPRGLLSSGGVEALDGETNTGWSPSYGFFRKKDGSFGHVDQSDAADDASFRATLDHARMKLGQLADGMLDGDVAVRPYRLRTFSPCSWCAMSSVCGFEMGVSDVRYLETLKRSEVFTRLTRGASGS